MEKLRSSGLRIEDEEVSRRVLADIGYFPVVNGYQSFFRDPSTRVYRETSARMESVSSPTGVTSRFLTRPCTPSSASKRLGRITLAAR